MLEPTAAARSFCRRQVEDAERQELMQRDVEGRSWQSQLDEDTRVQASLHNPIPGKVVLDLIIFACLLLQPCGGTAGSCAELEAHVGGHVPKRD